MKVLANIPITATMRGENSKAEGSSSESPPRKSEGGGGE